MKYVDEFRNKNLIRRLVSEIAKLTPKDRVINLMEVCGTHTMSFFRFGLRSLLPESIRLISGPGCPVCVSTREYLDKAIALAGDKNNIIVSFGDMIRVPASYSSLEKERAAGAEVKVVYSSLDSLEIARLNPRRNIIFLGVGFETTAPAIALTLLHARREGLKNFSILSSLKMIPPPMCQLAEDERLNIQGFICPGHVSAIIGLKPYEILAHRYNIGCVVAGFEPIDLLEAIILLLRQIQRGKGSVENQYSRVVKAEGNTQALKIIREVFKVVDTEWRGLGTIKKSGLMIRGKYRKFDAQKRFGITEYKNIRLPAVYKRCRCGDVLKGIISPKGCSQFRRLCTPANPLGPCMVSTEGVCNVYYKYEN